VASCLQAINFLGGTCGSFIKLRFKFTNDKMWGNLKIMFRNREHIFLTLLVHYLCYVNESKAVVTSENVGIDIEKFKCSY